jgi:hypothetical protein
VKLRKQVASVWVVEVQEGFKKAKGVVNLLKKIIQENVPNLEKDINI